MWMRFSNFFLLSNLAFSTFLGAEKLVLTFDHLPLERTLLMKCEARTEKYLKALDQEGIKAVFFAIGEEIDHLTPITKGCVDRLIEKGHLMGNHSYSHPHLSAITTDAYLADVLRCEKLTAEFSTHRKWFRYPFLDIALDAIEGASSEKAVKTAACLKKLGLIHAYVTIDSLDWFIDSLLQEACSKGQKISQEDLENFYVAHLKNTLPKYLAYKGEEYKDLFSTHVMLFHGNDLNALCLPKVIQMLKEEGWTFASPDEAFDPEKNAVADFDIFLARRSSLLKQDSPLKPVFLHNKEDIKRAFDVEVLHLPPDVRVYE